MTAAEWADVFRQAADLGVLQVHLSGGEPATTNNRMELMAVIAGLKALTKHNIAITIYTDSQYVMKAFTDGWLTAWVSRGWKKSDGGAVVNQDLWEELLQVLDQHEVEWHWVRGHSGHPENERVDREARRVVNEFKKKL